MSMTLFDLTGKTALVTGSSRGLGRAFADGLAAAGARVVLNGVNEERLAEAAAQMQSAGHKVLTAAFDVTDEAAIVLAFNGFDKDGIEIDILINIGSLTSELARATVAPYTVTKGGIKMLTKAMAAEWGELGIQANAIGPGYMITDMNEALMNNPEFDAWVKARTPMRRWGKPEELAGTVIYLASDASNYVSGQIIYADGGMISVL